MSTSFRIYFNTIFYLLKMKKGTGPFFIFPSLKNGPVPNIFLYQMPLISVVAGCYDVDSCVTDILHDHVSDMHRRLDPHVLQ